MKKIILSAVALMLGMSFSLEAGRNDDARLRALEIRNDIAYYTEVCKSPLVSESTCELFTEKIKILVEELLEIEVSLKNTRKHKKKRKKKKIQAVFEYEKEEE